MMEKKRKAVDASTSNAGDDFHLLWAVRRCFELLKPETKLKAVKPEGISPVDAAEIDSTGHAFLSVDLTEYFEGLDIRSSSVVRYSQLKYSTTKPSAPWTIAAVIAGKKPGSTAGSLIRRFADTFKKHREACGRDLVLAKLQIRLVSNQPACDVLSTALLAAKAELANEKVKNKASLLKLVDNGQQALIEELFNASGLGSRDFCDFLRVLDLSSNTAELSRARQEIEVTKTLGNLGFYETSDQRALLKSRVWDLSLPNETASITRDEMVAMLHGGRYASLFPSVSSIASGEKIIEREQALELAKEIATASASLLCVHGGGGFGKTTLIKSVIEKLPEHSISVIFDCFASGKYRNPEDCRHLHENGIRQIINELAVESHTEVLLNRDASRNELVRRFCEKLSVASKVAKASNPNALVCVFVDAADNSVSAAKERGDVSFVTDIVRCEIPSGCRVIVACRSHQISLLGLGVDSREIPIEAFNRDETEANLALHFQGLDPSQIDEFHKLTNGVPRVQAYALDLRYQTFDEILDALRPGGKVLDDIFERAILESGSRNGDQQLVDRVCGAIANLYAPAPMEMVAKLAGTTLEGVTDVCNDLPEGIFIADGTANLRDEDLEKYLKSRYPLTTEQKTQRASLLLSEAVVSEYASRNLGRALASAGLRKELLNLVENPVGLDAIPDPIERRQIQISRIKNAMQLVRSEKVSVVDFRLLFALSRESKAHKSTDQVLDEHPDLALQHGTPATVQRLYFSDRSEGAGDQAWRHMCCAGVYARRDGATATVREHQRLAEIGLREWVRLDHDQREDDPIDNHYIAMLVESYIRCDGYDAARKWLRRWRPRSFRMDICKRVAKNFFQFGLGSVDVSGAVLATELDALLAFIEASIESHKPIDVGLVEQLSGFLPTIQYRAKNPEHRRQFLNTVIASAEASAKSFDDCARWAEILDSFTPRPPEVVPRHTYGESAEELERFLRYVSLRYVFLNDELSAKDVRLVPERLKPKKSPPPANETDEESVSRREEEERISRQRDEHLSVCELLLPAFHFRAMALTGNLERSDYTKQLESALRATSSSNNSYWYFKRPSPWKARRAKLLCRTVLLTSSCIADDFEKVVDSFTEPWADLRVDLAEIAAAEPALHITAMKLVHEAFEQTQELAMPGAERVQFLVRCCQITSSIDPSAGQFYFDQTLKAAEDVDEEAFSVIKLLSKIARNKDTATPASDSTTQAESLACIVEDYSMRLDGHDHFPWTEAIWGIAHLSPEVATAMACRWDLTSRLSIGQSIPDLVEALLDRGSVDPRFTVATCLLPGNWNQNSFEVSLRALLKLRNESSSDFSTGLKELADYCVRGSEFEERIGLSRQYAEWLTKHGMALANVSKPLSQLVAFHEQEDGGEVTKPSATATARSQIPKSEPNAIDEAEPKIALSGTYCDRESIEVPLRTLEFQASNQTARWNIYSERLKLLQAMIAHVPLSRYVDHLNSLIEVSPQLVPFDQLVSATCDRLEQWKAHPMVSSWAKNAPKLIASRAVESLFGSFSFRSYVVEKLLDLADMDRSDFAQMMLKALPDSERLNQVEAIAVHDFASELVSTIDAATAEETLQMLLDKLTKDVRGVNSASNVSASVAKLAGRSISSGLAWYLLGHPDTRIRWRTIHACRQMHRIGHPIAEELGKWLGDGQSHAMCAPDEPFYWLAARQSCFLLIERLAEEAPNSMLSVMHLTLDELRHSPFPHVIVQRSCIRAIQAVAEATPGCISDSDLAFAVGRLRGKLASNDKRDRHHGLGGPWESKHSHRFDFDQMDTVRYWYDPLSNVFDLSDGEFFPVIEDIICQDWGISGHLPNRDRAKAMYPHASYTLFSNGHGSAPTVEDYHHHVELHAMFCAAIRLLDNHEIRLESYSHGDVNRWESWQERWDISIPPLWIADQRQATPLEERLWTEPPSEEWTKAPTDDEYDRATGFTESLHADYLQVWGNTDLFTSKASRDYRIRSALVTPDAADALMRTFQDSHPSTFRIPEEGDEDAEILESVGDIKLELRGWISDEHTETNRLEESDPYAYRMQPTRLRPGQQACKFFNMQFDNSTGRFRGDNPAGCIALREVWCDKPDRVDRESYGFFSEGERLWFHIPELLKFLRAIQSSLIIETQIVRRVDKGKLDDSFDDENLRGKHDWKSRIYIVDGTGNVSTVHGCHRIG
ncbi:hypothetical protein Q31b_54770 [Novipirellula aureliae]|uniref:Nephrocystin 3-like N-terminal domain-containing protein n=1 Tax=Novipirellula aureliae TaxID=2527966 RepID=A0A5C6DI25_9BACT|nr:ATP-binding protein [Novipirellula aureliae]TWU35381.1 hypothetical protein Q31b_54770 [Novipirellula aureliae]